MNRIALGAAAMLVFCSAAQSATPTRDDRYFVAWQGTAAGDVTRSVAQRRALVQKSASVRRWVARKAIQRAHKRLRKQREHKPAPGVVAPLTLAKGFRREVRRAVGLAGVMPRLAAKAIQIKADCGSRVISGVRHTYVAGTRRISLHASGRAVDMAGNPGCIYAHLRGWPGGYSTDYSAVRHVHISLGGREDGARFAHHRRSNHHRYARQRSRYARGSRGSA